MLSGGNGLFVKQGTGTLTLSANTYSGITVVDGGVLNLGNSNALQNSFFLGGQGTLAFDSTVSSHAFTLGCLSVSDNQSNINLRDNAGNPVALSVGNKDWYANSYAGVLSGPGSLTKVGDHSVLTLSGVNTYTGPTTVSNGTLILAAASPITSLPLQRSTLTAGRISM